jgi:hypothetical protein
MARPKKPGRRRRPAKARRRASSAPRTRRAKRAKASVRSGKRPKAAKRKARETTKPAARAKQRKRAAAATAPGKIPRLDRIRRTLDEDVVLSTPPSSLDMDRRGSAVRTGRAEMEENLRRHGKEMSPGLTGGDVDADYENAYFSGDEAPGGDNPTPDQDVVDEIGHSLGLEYNDGEELKSERKVSERDKHRWELDPASAEDYKDRD